MDRSGARGAALAGLRGVSCSRASRPAQQTQAPGRGQVSGKAWSQEKQRNAVGTGHLPLQPPQGAYFHRGHRRRKEQERLRASGLGTRQLLGAPPHQPLPLPSHPPNGLSRLTWASSQTPATRPAHAQDARGQPPGGRGGPGSLCGSSDPQPPAWAPGGGGPRPHILLRGQFQAARGVPTSTDHLMGPRASRQLMAARGPSLEAAP